MEVKKVSFKTKRGGVVFLLLGVLLSTVTFGLVGWLNQNYAQTLPPRTSINQINVGGLDPDDAVKKLKSENPPPEFAILKTASGSEKVKADVLGLDLNYKPTVQQVIKNFGAKPTLVRPILALYYLAKPIKVSQQPSLNRGKFDLFLDQLEAKLGKPAQPAYIELEKSGDPTSLVFHQVQGGVLIDKEKTASSFNPNTDPPEITLVLKPNPKKLTPLEVRELTKRAKQLVGKQISLVNKEHEIKINLNDQELVSFLDAYSDSWDESTVDSKIKEVAQKIDRPPKNAVFEYDPETLVVMQFEPDKPGLILDQANLKKELINVLDDLIVSEEDEDVVKLKLNVSQAKVKLKDTNNLGINELIGKGESLYYHSIPSRVHNVTLAAKRVNNIILKPKEEFSFNQAIGEVSAKTGYKSAYIIRNGRTEKGDGGGVCQVSTTLFRAVLDAGLKVTRRVPHSYRVSYYELDNKPGIDATVFDGNVDLRFVNDTPAHILIRSVNIPEKRHLRYEIYGTSDGRSTEIVDHKTWGWQPPLPPEYIVDPNLPPGTKKQIDWAAAGIKAKFTNVIKDKSGKIVRKDNYFSSYKPWSAKYLVGPDTQVGP